MVKVPVGEQDGRETLLLQSCTDALRLRPGVNDDTVVAVWKGDQIALRGQLTYGDGENVEGGHGADTPLRVDSIRCLCYHGGGVYASMGGEGNG